MANKCLMLMMFSWVLVGLCQGQGGGYDGGMGDEPPCMKNLLPCTLFIHKNSAPPSICCVPVKQLVSDNLKCFCDVFTNPLVMVSLNVTQEDAVNLVKRCGSNANADMCKNAGASAPTGSPSPPTGHNNSTAGEPPKSIASSLSKSGASFSILIILYFVLTLL